MPSSQDIYDYEDAREQARLEEKAAKTGRTTEQERKLEDLERDYWTGKTLYLKQLNDQALIKFYLENTHKEKQLDSNRPWVKTVDLGDLI